MGYEDSAVRERRREQSIVNVSYSLLNFLKKMSFL